MEPFTGDIERILGVIPGAAISAAFPYEATGRARGRLAATRSPTNLPDASCQRQEQGCFQPRRPSRSARDAKPSRKQEAVATIAAAPLCTAMCTALFCCPFSGEH